MIQKFIRPDYLGYLPQKAEAGQVAQWEADARAALINHPHEAAAIYFWMANTLSQYIMEQRPEDIIDWYTKATELTTINDQKAIGYHWQSSYYGGIKRDLEKMLECLYISLEYNPNYTPSLEDLARYYRFKQKFTKALAIYQQLLEIEDYHENPWSMIAMTYVEMKDYAKAEDAFVKALEREESAFDYIQLGKVLIETTRPQEALPFLNNALQMEPKNRNALLYMGNAYVGLQDYYRAMHCYHKILEAYPADVDAHVNISVCIHQTENVNAAIDYLRNILHHYKMSMEERKPIFFKLAQYYNSITDYDKSDFLSVLIAIQKWHRGEIGLDDMKDLFE